VREDVSHVRLSTHHRSLLFWGWDVLTWVGVMVCGVWWWWWCVVMVVVAVKVQFFLKSCETDQKEGTA
jgi:hypothetical protein